MATFIADLSSQASVRKLAVEVLARYPKLDVLVNNAGAMYGTRQLTPGRHRADLGGQPPGAVSAHHAAARPAEGERAGAHHHHGSQAHQGAHIPSTTSMPSAAIGASGATARPSSPTSCSRPSWRGASKGTGVTANCFHPGSWPRAFNRNNGLLTDLGMTALGLVARSPEQGADTLVWLATSPDVANVSGVYFFDQEQKPPSPEAQDTETAGRLWEISERQCAVSGRSAEAR